MKKLLISVLCIVLLLSFSGCASKEDYESEITAFYYAYGEEHNRLYYTINQNADAFEMVINDYSMGRYEFSLDGAREKHFTVTKEQMAGLNEVIVENKIYKWDGIDKDYIALLDRDMYDLSITYHNGKTVKTHCGLNIFHTFPKGHQPLVDYLANMARESVEITDWEAPQKGN
ncbi:MAG: hypothetical protein LBS74_01675 [Oscillospiraceae bacterium]|jgi:hypothetical protein|nr:hypothetical protein [Oscillospiraceae bacterium]